MARQQRLHTILAIVTVLALLPSGAMASKVTLTVEGGSLGLNPTGSAQLLDVNLTGQDQTTSGTLGLIDVIDARGTGDGWNVVVRATDFIKTSGGGDKIPAGGFIVDETPTVAALTGNAAPQTFGGPLNQPLKILSAPAAGGMGHYQAEPKTSLTVPADTFAGSYESTLTLTITSGP